MRPLSSSLALLALVLVSLEIIVILVDLTRPSAAFRIGVGSHDATPPHADIAFMGYADPTQVGGGIHTRLYARCFVIAEEASSRDGRRFAYCSVDFGMGSQAVTREVLRRLSVRYPGVYSWENVFISGTHTHAAPGGFSQYIVHEVPSLGFVRESFEAYVRGIVEAVSRAHLAMESGVEVVISRVPLRDANINRSPTAYANNPEDERAAYPDGNTDKFMTSLTFQRTSDGAPLGMFNFFSVHGTSLPSTNRLVSGDNKGYASQTLEAWVNARLYPFQTTLPGQGAFVGAFGATNLGDVSPNINGTFCDGSGLPCEELHSTCRGLNEYCHGRGPSSDPFVSCAIIGERQARAAMRAFEIRLDTEKKKTMGFHTLRDGKVGSWSRVVDFANVTVDLRLAGELMGFDVGDDDENEEEEEEISNQSLVSRFLSWLGSLFTPARGVANTATAAATTTLYLRRDPAASSSFDKFRRPAWARLPPTQTCSAALGYSFASGTTDGPGIANFYQGQTKGNAFWEAIRDLITVKPTTRVTKCQHPKPILLNLGELGDAAPYGWEPHILTVSVALIGDKFAMLSVPAEFTTMAGRRLKRAVGESLSRRGLFDAKNGHVVIAGLTNGYAHYTTTYEEYQIQRYEGASTIFGPHTLAAYAQEFDALASVASASMNNPAAPPARLDIDSMLPDFSGKLIALLPPASLDVLPAHKKFGEVLLEPHDEYVISSSSSSFLTEQNLLVVVKVEFLSANPRHDSRLGDTFFTIEESESPPSVWRVIRTDASFDTRLYYSRRNGVSVATVEWRVNDLTFAPDKSGPWTFRITHRGTAVTSGSSSSREVTCFQGVTRSFVVRRRE